MLMVVYDGARNAVLFPLSPNCTKILLSMRMSITSTVAFCRDTVMIAHSLSNGFESLS
jgi:hypothetical protein